MIFCKKCGRYYSEGVAVCTACGAALGAQNYTGFGGASARPASSGARPAPAPSSTVTMRVTHKRLAPEPGEATSRTGTAAGVAMALTTAAVAERPEPQPDAPKPAEAPASVLFQRDRFLLRQKAIALNEKYYVSDESGNPIVFVERPAMLGQQLAMIIGAAAAFLGGSFIIAFLSGFFGALLGAAMNTLLSTAGFILVLAVTGFTALALLPKRHVSFYTDDSRTEKVLEVRQQNKIEFPYANFKILDESGIVIATLRKNVLFDYFRRRWYCANADGIALCTIKEDSILLSLVRRTIPILSAFLRTNFVLLHGDRIVGEFNRRLTILDRYVLDMSADGMRVIDRRIALAIGVMLDTGERR